MSELCGRHVTRAKWVVVPSHALGHTLGERIALGGTNWLNLRFVTPLDLAVQWAPFLVERGIDPSEEGLGPALMMRELRMAGVRATDLRDDAFSSPAKRDELRALLAAYERRCQLAVRRAARVHVCVF